MRAVQDNVVTLLADASCNEDCIITPENVYTAISRLKVHKNEGSSDLSSDHIINAGNDLMVHILIYNTTVYCNNISCDTVM